MILGRQYSDLTPEEVTYLWRLTTLDEAIEDCTEPRPVGHGPCIVQAGLATEQRGVNDAALNAADTRLGSPMPKELRAFYRRVTPVPRCPPDAGFGHIGLHPSDDADLRWLNDLDERKRVLWTMPHEANGLDGWKQARVLSIGYTPFGDSLLWCDGLQGRPSGTIVLTDHESDCNPIVLADSFAQWLSRYDGFGFIECTIAPTSIDIFPTNVARAFLMDHLRLNARCRWAQKRLLNPERRPSL